MPNPRMIKDDPDLFWHLATGKWIAEHRALPDTDPFSFTTQTYAYEAYARTEEILKRYWLAQLLLYGSYVAGGYYGVIARRVLVFLGIFLLLFRWLREEGLDTPAALLFLAPLGFVLPPFVGDRPNQMTYLLALAALY